MKYHVTLRERTYVIDVDGGSVTIDGDRLEAHAAAIPGTPLLHVLLGKESWTVACQELDAGRWALGAVGERVEVEVQDDRSKQIEALTGQGRRLVEGGVVKAPMPGLVVRVEVSAADDAVIFVCVCPRPPCPRSLPRLARPAQAARPISSRCPLWPIPGGGLASRSPRPWCPFSASVTTNGRPTSPVSSYRAAAPT